MASELKKEIEVEIARGLFLDVARFFSSRLTLK